MFRDSLWRNLSFAYWKNDTRLIEKGIHWWHFTHREIKLVLEILVFTRKHGQEHCWWHFAHGEIKLVLEITVFTSKHRQEPSWWHFAHGEIELFSEILVFTKETHDKLSWWHFGPCTDQTSPKNSVYTQ